MAFALVFVLANAWSGRPAWSPVQRDPGGDTRFRQRIEHRQAAVVLLGNSMLGEGIDLAGFERRIGRPSVKIVHGGAASAWWWVIFRHQIAEASPRPEHVVVFFRDSYLTDPAFRTRGIYKARIDRFCMAEEEILDELAYTRPLGPAELWLSRGLPLYRNREAHRMDLDQWLRERVEGLVPRAPGGLAGVLQRTFSDDRMQPELVNRRQLEAETRVEEAPDFEEVLPDSFLAPMLDLAHARGIALHFVRVKRRRDLSEPQSPALRRYTAGLRRYLEARGARLLDYSGDPRIRLEHFAHGDHLDRGDGRRLFTAIVAEDLAPDVARRR